MIGTCAELATGHPNELYVYKSRPHVVIVLDGETLDVRRSFRVPRISPGDAVLVWDPARDSLAR